MSLRRACRPTSLDRTIDDDFEAIAKYAPLRRARSRAGRVARLGTSRTPDTPLKSASWVQNVAAQACALASMMLSAMGRPTSARQLRRREGDRLGQLAAVLHGPESTAQLPRHEQLGEDFVAIVWAGVNLAPAAAAGDPQTSGNE